LEQREDEQEAKRKLNKDAKFTAEETFFDAAGNKVEDKNLKLPYATIEIVFNHKNIWANLGN